MFHAAGGVQEGEDRTGPASIAFDSGEVTGDFERGIFREARMEAQLKSV